MLDLLCLRSVLGRVDDFYRLLPFRLLLDSELELISLLYDFGRAFYVDGIDLYGYWSTAVFAFFWEMGCCMLVVLM